MHRLVLQIGDGGDGGGVVLRDVKWGERALAAAQEVLAGHFGDDVAMFAFKVSPKGYVYVRLDKLTNMSVTLFFKALAVVPQALLGLVYATYCCACPWAVHKLHDCDSAVLLPTFQK